MQSKFFTFIAPYLAFIDSGKFFRRPFSWLYAIMAIINLVLPFYVLYHAINSGIFRTQVRFVLVFILVWFAVALACWIGFQIWWDRKSKLSFTSVTGDDFITTPVFSHFIQTMGEWLGTWIAVVGFIFSLLATIFLGREGYLLSRQMGLGFFNIGLLSIILMPVYGYLIIIVSRFFAEQFRALVSIANNTSKK